MARSDQLAGAEAVEHGRDVPTLLLIEAGSAVRELLAAAPGMLQVKHAPSLADGLAMLITEPVRAVLIDLSLPQTRDLTIIDEVRRIAPNAAIMVLASSADQALARRGVDRGASDYVVVTDQIDARTLWQMIAMMFERRGLEQQKFVERERAEITLNSIGDAVMTTDTRATSPI